MSTSEEAPSGAPLKGQQAVPAPCEANLTPTTRSGRTSPARVDKYRNNPYGSAMMPTSPSAGSYLTRSLALESRSPSRSLSQVECGPDRSCISLNAGKLLHPRTPGLVGATAIGNSPRQPSVFNQDNLANSPHSSFAGAPSVDSGPRVQLGAAGLSSLFTTFTPPNAPGYHGGSYSAGHDGDAGGGHHSGTLGNGSHGSLPYGPGYPHSAMRSTGEGPTSLGSRGEDVHRLHGQMHLSSASAPSPMMVSMGVSRGELMEMPAGRPDVANDSPAQSMVSVSTGQVGAGPRTEQRRYSSANFGATPVDDGPSHLNRSSSFQEVAMLSTSASFMQAATVATTSVTTGMGDFTVSVRQKPARGGTSSIVPSGLASGYTSLSASHGTLPVAAGSSPHSQTPVQGFQDEGHRTLYSVNSVSPMHASTESHGALNMSGWGGQGISRQMSEAAMQCNSVRGSTPVGIQSPASAHYGASQSPALSYPMYPSPSPVSAISGSVGSSTPLSAGHGVPVSTPMGSLMQAPRKDMRQPLYISATQMPPTGQSEGLEHVTPTYPLHPHYFYYGGQGQAAVQPTPLYPYHTSQGPPRVATQPHEANYYHAPHVLDSSGGLTPADRTYTGPSVKFGPDSVPAYRLTAPRGLIGEEASCAARKPISFDVEQRKSKKKSMKRLHTDVHGTLPSSLPLASGAAASAVQHAHVPAAKVRGLANGEHPVSAPAETTTPSTANSNFLVRPPSCFVLVSFKRFKQLYACSLDSELTSVTSTPTQATLNGTAESGLISVAGDSSSSNLVISVGDLVVVEGDRGDDAGIVEEIYQKLESCPPRLVLRAMQAESAVQRVWHQQHTAQRLQTSVKRSKGGDNEKGDDGAEGHGPEEGDPVDVAPGAAASDDDAAPEAIGEDEADEGQGAATAGAASSSTRVERSTFTMRKRMPRIIRIATESDTAEHAQRRKREAEVLVSVQRISKQLAISATVEDVAFQMDGRKLTVFLRRQADAAFVDFRRVQRRLYRRYQCRIWMLYLDEVEEDEERKMASLADIQVEHARKIAHAIEMDGMRAVVAEKPPQPRATEPDAEETQDDATAKDDTELDEALRQRQWAEEERLGFEMAFKAVRDEIAQELRSIQLILRLQEKRNRLLGSSGPPVAARACTPEGGSSDVLLPPANAAASWSAHLSSTDGMDSYTSDGSEHVLDTVASLSIMQQSTCSDRDDMMLADFRATQETQTFVPEVEADDC